jgi:hypothetical protein
MFSNDQKEVGLATFVSGGPRFSLDNHIITKIKKTLKLISNDVLFN